MWPINVYAETIFQQITFTHHFIDISQNILYLRVRLIWIETRHLGFQFDVRLIWIETRHLGFQFDHKNEAIPIRIEKDMIF